MDANRASLHCNRAVLDELHQTQCQTKETLSNLRDIIKQWTPRNDNERAQQERKLKDVLLSFERAAIEVADEEIALSVASFRLVSAFRPSVGGHLLVVYLPKPLAG